MSTVRLANGQIAKVINGPYYHSNLDNFDRFGGKDGSFPGQLRGTVGAAKNDLIKIIKEQELRELKQLDKIFGDVITKDQLLLLGFDPVEATSFLNCYNKGKNAVKVDTKIKYLNLLMSYNLKSDKNNTVFDGLNEAINLIEKAFGESDLSINIDNLPSLTDYQVFLSALIAVHDSLLASQKKLTELLPKEIILRPINKLRAAINFYRKEYFQKVTKETEYSKRLRKWTSSLSSNEIIKASWNADKANTRRNLNSMKAVVKESANGYVTQLKGKDYEKGVANLLAKQIGLIFDGQKIKISTEGTVVGGIKDSLDKFQKSDVKISIELMGDLPGYPSFSLLFSVKLSTSSSTIQIHHGGGLFAYEKRFAQYSPAIANILSNPNFKYNYVNSLHQDGSNGDYISAFKEMLRAAGFYFLGAKIKDKEGADFLYVNGNIVAFSYVLKEALKDPNIFSIRIRQNKYNALSEKKRRIRLEFSGEGYDDPENYYSDEFIAMGKEIGRRAINATTFTLDLRKSSLNL